MRIAPWSELVCGKDVAARATRTRDTSHPIKAEYEIYVLSLHVWVVSEVPIFQEIAGGSSHVHYNPIKCFAFHCHKSYLTTGLCKSMDFNFVYLRAVSLTELNIIYISLLLFPVLEFSYRLHNLVSCT